VRDGKTGEPSNRLPLTNEIDVAFSLEIAPPSCARFERGSLPAKVSRLPVSLIDIVAAEKVFPNGIRALEPITLSVRERELTTILGPSGCGKTTLLRMVAGLLAPSAGRIRVGDGGAQRLAFVFQTPTLMAWASVARNVRLPLDLGRVEDSEADRRVDRALALVGLQEFRGAYPRELSGGMQMRASIARALATESSLLLMDEPFGALDEITRARLDRELVELWSREALTILFVTHSIYEAVFLSTRVVVMAARPGRIIGEIAIDVPQPRHDDFRISETFARCCAQLSAMLAAAAAEPELAA
jgi:NitT/TauT family transport system ATP-binding protein